MPAASIHDTTPHGLTSSLGAKWSAGSMPKLALAWNVTSIYCRGSPDDAFPLEHPNCQEAARQEAALLADSLNAYLKLTWACIASGT